MAQRCEERIERALATLENERACRNTLYWFGDRLTHADVAVAVATTFVGQANPEIVARNARPALAAHTSRCEQLPALKAVAPAPIV